MKLNILLLIVFSFGYSQNVSVKLNFINTPDSIPITASKSINHDAGSFLSNTDTIFTKDNTAELKFTSANPGYMSLGFSTANPGITLLFEPGENINLDVSKDQNNKYFINYRGKNSPLLLLINTDTVYKYQRFSQKLRKVIFEADDSSEILQFIKKEHKDALKKLKILHGDRKISNGIYPVAKLHLESTLAYNAKSIIEDIFRIEEEFTKTKISKGEFVKLLYDVMTYINLFDDRFKNFASWSLFDGQQSTAKFIDESGATAKMYDSNLWKNENVREYYNYLPLYYQERLFAFLFVNDRLNENDFLQFKKIFPNSKYTGYLEKYWKGKTAVVYQPGAFGYFINNEFKYEKQVNIIEIRQIIKDYFDGKPVFVDLWAAYCAPCFQEFSHSQKLFAFLKTNDIEMLYIAIDNEKDIAKWDKNIKRNFLEGNHIFASDKIQESLQKLLNEPQGVYIPRYLLFNDKGELVLPSTKKPSEGQELYNQILNALEKK